MTEHTQNTTSTFARVDRRAGRYLTFGLGNEEFGLEILKVREINGSMTITAVPEMPPYIKGVINLRGNAIPVIDIRLKFGMPESPRTAESCIIIVDILGKLMGIIVDRVSEVLDIKSDEIEDAPHIGTGANSTIILGMAKVNGRIKILLDIDQVLSDALALTNSIR